MSEKFREDVSDEDFEPQGEQLFEPGENEMRNFPRSAGDSYQRAIQRFQRLGAKAGDTLASQIQVGFKSLVVGLGGSASGDVEEEYMNDYMDFASECQAAYLSGFSDNSLMPIDY